MKILKAFAATVKSLYWALCFVFSLVWGVSSPLCAQIPNSMCEIVTLVAFFHDGSTLSSCYTCNTNCPEVCEVPHTLQVYEGQCQFEEWDITTAFSVVFVIPYRRCRSSLSNYFFFTPNLAKELCPNQGETREENCQDFVLAANDVINIVEGTTQDQEMIKTIRRLVQVDHDTTAAVNLLATVNSRAAKRMALEYYIKKAMWNAAQQVLNSLPNSTQDEQFFKQLYTIKRDLAQSNRSIFQITAAEEATITNIANHRTRTSFEAQAILYLVRQIEFPVPMEHLPLPLPAYTGTLPTIHFKNDFGNTNTAMPIKVYPNPAKDILQLQVPSEYPNCSIAIYFANGNTVFSKALNSGDNTLSLSNVPTGWYYYIIKQQDSIIQRHPLIVIR